MIADVSRPALQCIERNARNVLKADFDARVRILRADYRAAIEKAEGPFDLVFLDPPYRMTDAYADALTRLAAAGRLLSGRTLESLGEELMEYVLAVAGGRRTRNEENGFHDLAIFKQGVTL